MRELKLSFSGKKLPINLNLSNLSNVIPAKRRLELIPKEAITRKSKKQRIDLMLRLSLARAVINRPLSSDRSSSSSSSPSTSDAEINPHNLLTAERVYKSKLESKKISSALKAGLREYKRQSKQQGPDI